MLDGSFWRSLFKEGISNALFEGLKYICGAGLAALGATVTLILGKFYPEVPLPYLFAAASLVFAAIGLGFAAIWVGLLRFDELRAKRTSANKLTLSAPAVIFDYIRDSAGGITEVEYAQIVMFLGNIATFNISYVIDEISSSLDGRVNQDAKPILKGVVPPLNIHQYRPDRIDMRGSLLKPRIEAKLKFKMRYGRIGHEKYPLDKISLITCVFDKNTGYANQISQDVTQ
jgi:hypothetical protein